MNVGRAYLLLDARKKHCTILVFRIVNHESALLDPKYILMTSECSFVSESDIYYLKVSTCPELVTPVSAPLNPNNIEMTKSVVRTLIVTQSVDRGFLSQSLFLA